MILFTVLTIVLIIGIIIATVAAGTLGLAVMITFGDIIVFALIVGLIIKLIKRKKK